MKASKPGKQGSGEVELSGRVIQKKFAAGSKSEHDAVYLETKEDTYQLRRLGGNPFVDKEFKKMLGKTVIASGRIMESIFFATKLKSID